MKHKLLILTRNPVAKVGIASYLSSLFGQYLTIVSTRIADLTPEDMEDAGCILYTAGELKEQMPFSIPDSVCVHLITLISSASFRFRRDLLYTLSMIQWTPPMRSWTS